MTIGIKNVLAGFIVMLCLGSVYAWSVFVPSLKQSYNWSTSETQIVFGVLIAVFTLSMTFSRSLLENYGPRVLGTMSGTLFLIGYGSAIFSGGSFSFILVTVGIIVGISTGLGYLVSISIPVQFYPGKKGLVTGLCAAGFGAGAIVLSYFTNFLFQGGFSVLTIFSIVGCLYGLLIVLFSQWFRKPPYNQATKQPINIHYLLRDKKFYRLLIGIFTGTFAGLLVIGNLKPIGLQYAIEESYLLHGVALFSIANFLGRIVWGWVSDSVRGSILIPLSLILIGVGTLLLGTTQLTAFSFLLFAFLIGFSFGANFVLYAKETAQLYGVENVSTIYPFVFLGYGISGITGPVIGGILHDMSGSYESAALVSFFLTVVAVIVYFIIVRNNQKVT
ncbi:MAG: MFS transporter [Bacteroidetes bacterium]|nr:MFS transporter [Bacteroidota bacterium]